MRTTDRTGHRLVLIMAVAGLLAGARFAHRGEWSAHGTSRADAASETTPSRVRANAARVLEAIRGAHVVAPELDVVWLTPPDPRRPEWWSAFTEHSFLLLAVPPGSSVRDLYRMEARVAPSGLVWAPSWAVNLTRSRDADDGALTVHDGYAATTVRWRQHLTGIEIRNLAGEDPRITGVASWSFWQQQGDRITNLERTGLAAGIAVEHYTVIDGDVTETITLGLGPGRLLAHGADGRTLADVGLASGLAFGPMKLERLPAEQKMPMQLLNWVADRGRGFADQGLAPRWVGVSIEMAKELYFVARRLEARWAAMRGGTDDDEERAEAATTENEPAELEDLGPVSGNNATTAVAAFHAPSEVTAPVEPPVPPQPATADGVADQPLIAREDASVWSDAFPWPPTALPPMLDSAQPGEGTWVPVSDSKVARDATGRPPFYQTFLRPAAKYSRKRVHIVAWDPRQLDLRMRAGTREPVPQTGHRGDGRVPRAPETLSNLVAAFNGGFQTTHTTWGMMVDGRLLLNPRAHGATIGRFRDGRTAMGTWKQGEPIPKDLADFRQNLHPLIEDGVFNAYHRRRFGAHQNVAGAKDGWTVRSALCTTQAGMLMYFWANFTNERALADTLLHAGCTYAIHLDMNWGHTGFEFYRQLGPRDAPDPEHERTVEGIRIRGTTPASRVRHMNHPVRYLGVDYRDFFYLVRRPALPPPALTATDAGPEHLWEISRLPGNESFPPRWVYSRTAGFDVAVLDSHGIDATIVTPEDAAPDIDPDRLFAALPVGPAEGDAAITVAGVPIRGMDASSVDLSTPVRAATVLGVDKHGFVWMAFVRNAALGDAVQELRARCTGALVVRQPDPASVAHAYDRLHESSHRLLELIPGAEQGMPCDLPDTSTTMLLLHRRDRGARVERLWPDANPWKFKRVTKKSSRRR